MADMADMDTADTTMTTLSTGEASLYLTLARSEGVDATPHEFFQAGRRTVWRIVLKFSIAYGASFAQLLVKTKMVRSGQVTKL